MNTSLEKKYFRQRILVQDGFWVFCTLIFSLASVFFAEKVSFNGGLGWDGVAYAHWAQDFKRLLLEKGFSSFQLKRVFPSAVVFLALRCFKFALSDNNVIRAFGFYNSIILSLSVYLWCRLSKLLSLNLKSKIIGFAALFLNFAFLKYYFYYPCLTDCTALLISLSMLYFYLSDRLAPLLLTVLVGSFAWPTSFYVGALYLLFPRKAAQEIAKEDAPRKWLWTIAIFSTALLFLSAISLLRVPATAIRLYPFALGIEQRFLAISLTIAMTFFAFYLSGIMNSASFFNLKFWLNQVRWKRIILVLCLSLVLKMITHQLADASAVASTQREFLYVPAAFVLVSIAQPATSLVSHTIFWGPCFLLFLFFWTEIAFEIRKNGLGLSLVALLGGFFFLNNESRGNIDFYAALVPFLAKAINRYQWENWKVWTLVLISVAYSRFWMPLETTKGNWERYFSFFGGYMSWPSYLNNLIGIIAAFVLLYWICYCAKIKPLLEHD